MKALVLRPGEGERLEVGASSVVLKADSDATDGRFALIVTTIAPGFQGPRPHVHRETLDMFFVLEGTLTMQVGDETVDLRSGSFVAVPPGMPHTFSNHTDQQVRLLNMDAPAGLESYLREMAGVMAKDPIDPANVAEIQSRYDIVPVD